MRRLILPAIACSAVALFMIVVNFSGQPLFAGIRVAEATSTPALPTASFTAQSGTSGPVSFLTVATGDSVTFQWNTTNAQSVVSNVTPNSPDSCPAGTFLGIAQSLSGRATLKIKDCQVGHTYTLSYQGIQQQQAGNITSPPSTVVLRVNPLPAPTGTLQVQNATRRGAWGASTEASAGDTLAYKWSATNATAASSTITASIPDNCHPGDSRTTLPWIVTSVRGQANIRIAECQAARTYTVSFTPVRQGTVTATGTSSIVTVQVSPLPDPIAYVYGRIGNSASTSTTLTVNPGDLVSYSWLSRNADMASSTISADQPDTCHGTSALTTFPWVANNVRGQARIQIPVCQAGRTYTIRYQAGRKLTGKMSTQAIMTVKVNPLPDPLSYLYGHVGNTQSTSTTLTVNSGDTITYNWLSLNADTASSTVTVDQPDLCRPGDTHTTFPWVAQTLRRQVSDKVKDCQAGRTYTIHYQAWQKTSGKISQAATMTVRVNSLPEPTAILSVRKSTEQTTSTTVTVNVGDTLYYNWLATYATTASSTVSADQPDTCRRGDTRTTFPWVANNLRGQANGKIQSCQEGRTYTITYTSVRKLDGAKSSPATIVVKVNMLPRPTATLTVRKNTDQAPGSTVSTKPGETLIYNWLSTNATAASSTVTVDQPDHCQGASDTRTVFPWAAKTTRGQTSGRIQDCQVGRTYTIIYQSNRASVNQVSEPATIVVNVAPKQ